MPDEHPSAIGGAFRRPFAEQVAFFRQKLGRLVPTRRWDDLTGAAHDHAFMVAGAQKADLLAELATTIDRAIAEGTGLETFRRDFRAAVDRHDWHGWTGEDTKGGRAWRTRTIYRTNTYTAYAAGRFAQLTAAKWKYWVYLHGGSKDPRPEHLNVFNGLILPPDHPFWAKHYPPSDWGCSCYVVGANTLAQAKRLGGDPTRTLPDGWDAIDPATGEPAGVGRGWGYAPGASVAGSINDKVASWPAEIGHDFLASLPPAIAAPIAPPPTIVRSVDDLDETERGLIAGYTAGQHRAINDPLREESRMTPEAAALEALLARVRFGKDALVYRMLGGDDAAGLIEQAPGRDAILQDVGFASTSRRIGVARKFKRLKSPPHVLLVVRLLPGARALDIAAISAYPKQREILLQRDVRMRVVHWDAENGTCEVEVGP